MKTCSSCAIEYSPYGQRSSLCRDCRRVYDREYHKNRSPEAKAKKLKLQKERTLENARFVYKYLCKHSCEQCGESRVPCLQFDHLENKVGNISDMVQGYSLDSIKLEISKCRVLCANCHAIRTAEQFAWYSEI